MTSIRPLQSKRSSAKCWVCPSCQLQQNNPKRNSYSISAARSLVTQRPTLRSLAVRNNPPFKPSRRQFSTTFQVRAAPTRQPKLPNSPARTRFAPSPTGYLHIGGLRTALFSYLLAKRTEGEFVLRIEDTDQKRVVPDAESRLSNDLQWAGLQWDEGPGVGGPYGPYRQSERNQIYQEHARHLLDGGTAYRCFCTQQSSSNAQIAYVTSGCYQDCSSLSVEESQERAEDRREAFTVRLHQPENANKRVYPDLVYGKIQRLKRSPATPQTASEDDMSIDASDTILLKSDGTPTYHFANVVDDHLMKITHVIRGSEWMASTPLHYDIYSAFGWEAPQFAHVGLLVDQNKAKLSKRNKDLALDVASMRDEYGVLPYSLNNFLALLGWSNPTDNDVMDLEALVRNFDLKFTRGNTMVRMEKLWYLQKQHVALRCREAGVVKRLLPIKEVVAQIIDEAQRVYSDPFINDEMFSEIHYTDEMAEPSPIAVHCTEVLLADSKSYQNAKQFVERNRYFFAFDPVQVPAEPEFYNKAKTLTGSVLHQILKSLFQGFHPDRVVDEFAGDKEAAFLEYGFSIRESGFASLEYHERAFHAALVEQIWAAAIADTDLFRFPFDEPAELLPSEDEKYNPDLIPYTAQPIDVESKARAFCEDLAERQGLDNSAVDPALVNGLVRRYKVLNSALMRYLREKLAYGLPGPSMSMVMALLGRHECCRRLGLEPNDVAELGSLDTLETEDYLPLARELSDQKPK